jgi:hypothetical protein
MPQKKSTARKEATPEDPAADEPAGRAGGPTPEVGPGEGTGTLTEAPAEPAVTPAGKKLAAVRMLTRSVAGKKPAADRGKAQRVADSAKPSQKPQAGGGRRGPRRGASKGR